LKLHYGIYNDAKRPDDHLYGYKSTDLGNVKEVFDKPSLVKEMSDQIHE